MNRKCKDCGNEFQLSDNDIKYYESKNYELPKRCESCRKKSREEKNSTNYSKNNKNTIKTLKNKPVKTLIALLVLAVYFLSSHFFPASNSQVTNQSSSNYSTETSTNYAFSTDELLNSHFDKHYNEFEYSTKEEYVAGANKVILNPNSLHKVEDDGDDIYYLEETNEFVIVSPDGYIRTYFKPTDGLDYFLRT